MILLLLGTNPYPFNRLFNAVEEWAAANNKKVIAQTGHTPANSKAIECHDFVDYSIIQKWIGQAEFVICQGGFGSLQDCIKQNKAVLAVPRYQELNESMDSQRELVEALSEEGYVMPLYDVALLEEAIDKLSDFQPEDKKQSAIPALISTLVDEYIN